MPVVRQDQTRSVVGNQPSVNQQKNIFVYWQASTHLLIVNNADNK